jgi:hypothetical protein
LETRKGKDPIQIPRTYCEIIHRLKTFLTFLPSTTK